MKHIQESNKQWGEVWLFLVLSIVSAEMINFGFHLKVAFLLYLSQILNNEKKMKEYFNFEALHFCFSFAYRYRYSHFPSIIDHYVNSLLYGAAQQCWWPDVSCWMCREDWLWQKLLTRWKMTVYTDTAGGVQTLVEISPSTPHIG